MTGADKEILDDYDQESSSDDSQADFHAKMLDIHKDLDQKNQLALSNQLNQNGGALINLDEDPEEEQQNTQLRLLIDQHLKRMKEKKDLKKQHKKETNAIQKGLEMEYGSNIVLCDSDCSHCATENHQHERSETENDLDAEEEKNEPHDFDTPPSSKVSSKQRKVSKPEAGFEFVLPSNGKINPQQVNVQILKENEEFEKEC